MGATVANLIEHATKSRIVADNLAEIPLGADLVLQIQLLFGQLILELRDLLKRGGVLDRDGRLAGHLGEKVDVGRRKGVLLRAADVERSEHAVSGDQRNAANRLQPRRRQPLRQRRAEPRQFLSIQHHRTPGFHGSAGGCFIQRRRGPLRDDVRISFEHQRIVSQQRLRLAPAAPGWNIRWASPAAGKP